MGCARLLTRHIDRNTRLAEADPSEGRPRTPALVGVPYDGASVVRTGRQKDLTRFGGPCANTPRTSPVRGLNLNALHAADIGDVNVVSLDIANV